MNLLSLVSGDPRLALLDCLSHHLSAVDRASLIAEKTEPTSAFEAFAVFVPDRIACTAYSDCFRAAGTLQWGRHLYHAPSISATLLGTAGNVLNARRECSGVIVDVCQRALS